ncbi:hypothetical protein BGZ46_000678, partial [Entomortierella lignicola]
MKIGRVRVEGRWKGSRRRSRGEGDDESKGDDDDGGGSDDGDGGGSEGVKRCRSE